MEFVQLVLSLGPARSMGRPTFIKWNGRGDYNHQLHKKESYTSILKNG